MTNLVEVKDNQIVTTSRQVAEAFGKLHKDVLEAIRGILSAENSANKFFCESFYMYRGRKLVEYYMNCDGFSLLAMGFTGKKALKWLILKLSTRWKRLSSRKWLLRRRYCKSTPMKERSSCRRCTS